MEKSNVQSPDFQATLKSIDDEIRYESSMKAVVDLKSCNGLFNAENNNVRWVNQGLNHADQAKPITEAQNATLAHPKSGPTEENRPNNTPLDLENGKGPEKYPKSIQATWKRIIKSPDLNNHEATLCDLAFRREIRNSKNPIPTKYQALDSNDASPLPTTLVAIEQPYRRQ